MIAAANADLGAALEAGDVAAAKAAHEYLGKLLGTLDGNAAPVVDLATERTRRGRR